jgi:tetratricopeptide (TPR) repeat protein
MTRDETAAFLRVADEALGVQHARSAFESGLFRHGFAVLNALLARDDTSPDAWIEKGRTYQAFRFRDAAIRCYRRALALRSDPLVEIALACALADCEKLGEAVEIYDALIGSSRGAKWSAVAHANRGNAHAALGRIEAAVSDYEDAIIADPRGVTHYLNYARLLSLRKRWAEAHDVVLRGLRAVTGHARLPLLIEKARTANEQERADVGLSAAEEALALAPDDRRGLYQRGWALGMLGRLSEARASMRQILDVDPNDSDAKRALDMIESALRG